MTADAIILWLEDCNLRKIGRVGGKTANLGEMTQAGIAVPPGFAITKDAYEVFVTGSGVWGEIQRIMADLDGEDMAAVSQAGQEVRGLIENHPLPEAIAAAVHAAYANLAERLGMEDPPVAVRSSATAEDLPGASFAGQQATYLWVRGADRVTAGTQSCWASLFSDRAIAYRARMDFPLEGLAIGVAVQLMVDARAAGVMFTRDPITGNAFTCVIEANWGLGESVVQGMVVPDRFVVDRHSLDLRGQELGAKTLQVVPAHPEVRTEEVPAELRDHFCLTEAEVRQLAELGNRVERHYGSAQDIEWAIDRHLPAPDNLFLLQSRPITAAGKKSAVPVAKDNGRGDVDHIIDLMLKVGFKR